MRTIARKNEAVYYEDLTKEEKKAFWKVFDESENEINQNATGENIFRVIFDENGEITEWEFAL